MRAILSVFLYGQPELGAVLGPALSHSLLPMDDAWVCEAEVGQDLLCTVHSFAPQPGNGPRPLKASDLLQT